MKKYLQANRQLWDQWSKAHPESEMYDVPGFLNGRNSLKPIEIEALGDLTNKSLLHLQCHFGQDTLSMARMGAKVCGLDFSSVAIEQANKLNAQLQLDARFVQADVLQAKGLIEEQFDIVFTSYGVLVWLPNLEAWAEVVSHYLKSGGIFCIVEFHPMLMCFDFEKLTVAYPYFHQKEPDLELVRGSYAVEEMNIEMEEYVWSHSLSEIISPLLKNGLQLLEFEEYPYSPYNCFPGLVERPDGNFEHKELKHTPHLFMLKMRKS